MQVLAIRSECWRFTLYPLKEKRASMQVDELVRAKKSKRGFMRGSARGCWNSAEEGGEGEGGGDGYLVEPELVESSAEVANGGEQELGEIGVSASASASLIPTEILEMWWLSQRRASDWLEEILDGEEKGDAGEREGPDDVRGGVGEADGGDFVLFGRGKIEKNKSEQQPKKNQQRW